MRYEVENIDTIFKYFNVDEKKGYDIDQVLEKRLKFGLNELEKEENTPLWKLVLQQFDDALVKILLGAATVSFLLALFDHHSSSNEDGISGFVEPIVILIILILNAIVGVWQESNAEAALEALKDLQPECARVLRNNKMITIPSIDLVPGDIVEIRVGDKIPADIRLFYLKTTSMRVEQSQMTGESTSVNKIIESLPLNTENIIQAKHNILFATTSIVNGMGKGIVIKTGMNTEIGQIQKSVKEASLDEEATPLRRKLDEFGELLSKVIGIICILVWLINYKNFFDPAHGSVVKGCIYYFKIAVALAVAAIPEGLPAVITTCLALGTRKMAKKNAIVRKLPSVETLGCTTVICSDKTGTLTTNEMSCITLSHFDNTVNNIITYDVEGHTYAPIGDIKPSPTKDNKAIYLLSAVCSLCNEATIEYNDGKYIRIGEPTEAALRVLVEKIGIQDEAVTKNIQINNENNYKKLTVQACNDYWKSQYKIMATLEFARDRKSMSVLCTPSPNNIFNYKNNVLFVKGAPEGIISRCIKIKLKNGQSTNMTSDMKQLLLNQVEIMAKKSLRCLAIAIREDTKELSTYNGDRHHEAHQLLTNNNNFMQYETDLTFIGLTGMLDPPRPEVLPMIKKCQGAGIRVIMITGDNKLTAESIAKKIGILSATSTEKELSYRSFTGAGFFQLEREAQIEYLLSSSHTDGLVFSRTEPKHKQMLVKMLKNECQEVVAMTGDGVNDAPALKQADIGIAMGITGTEVAKQAADMVLADDNFATIVSAVEEGRAIYNNMQAFIRYLISSNIGEVAAIFFTAAFGIPEGLIPVQLLWVNLVTDGPPATALGFNPPDNDIMKRPPRKATDVLITNWVFFRYMVIGTYVGLACVGVFAYWYLYYDLSDDGHTLISFYQLSHWTQCKNWKNFKVNNFDGMNFKKDPCKYFTEGKVTASTLSLSVLVTIEMLNALNALSEDGSLFTMPPWSNPYLLLAMIVSFGMHFVILYVDFLAKIFHVTPLDYKEWLIVLLFSFPVIIIDEALKWFGRKMAEKEYIARTKEMNNKSLLHHSKSSNTNNTDNKKLN